MRLAARVRQRLAKRDHAGALELLTSAWLETRSHAIAQAIDAVDPLIGGEPVSGETKAWVAAAKTAKPSARGNLVRGIAGRTATDTLKVLKIAMAWRDPRLTHAFHQLLVTLPWAGKRSRATWRDIFTHLAKHGDPRFVEIAKTLAATWKVGGEMQTWLTNQLTAATRALEPVVSDDEAELVTLAGELRATAPAPARVPATAEALLAAIYANPDDDGPRGVYADWLQERGDVRGELIALQLRRTSNPAARKRERELVKHHKKAWLGPLAPVLRGEVEFRRGFPATGTATFRHQRDVEQFGPLIEWATIEELEWSHQIVRIDQRRWARFVGPAMTSLRIARRPALEHLLAATRPWRLETIELDARELDPAMVESLATSKLFPALQTLALFGWGANPSWLAKISRCPPHLAVSGTLGNPECMAWLVAAAKTELVSLSIQQYGGMLHRFTRDPGGAFSRLDIEIRPPTRTKSLEPLPHPLPDLLATMKTYPIKKLTHFSAVVELGGELVPATPIVDAVRKRAPSLQ